MPDALNRDGQKDSEKIQKIKDVIKKDTSKIKMG